MTARSHATALIEAGGKPDPSGLAIEVHIIAPGWGSSGYYSESVLQNACKQGVYPVGMHMHLDHPTREAEKSQPARTISGQSPLVATLSQAGHYETEGWDKSPDNPSGCGVYATARVLPRYVEDIKALADSIGISHYVDGIAEDGEACGKKGKIIKELKASPLNTVDFVTVPGAGGHYRTLFNESKKRESQSNDQRKTMADNHQESLTLSEVRTSHPEIVSELRKQLAEELKIESLNESQKTKLTEAENKVKDLEKKLTEARQKIAEGAARTYVTEEIAKTKLPATVGKALTEALLKAAPLAEDGSLDTGAFATTVSEAIKGKQAEVAAILKEAGSGMHDNGTPSFQAGGDAEVRKAKEELRDSYIGAGKTREEANRLVGIKEEA